MISFSIIAAVDASLGLGREGGLAWKLSADLKHFKELTIGKSDGHKINAVIMGRRTWESLPPKSRPLPGRVNVVLTRRTGYDLPEAVRCSQSLDLALQELNDDPNIGEVFVIGGAEIYLQAISHPSCNKIYLTRLQGDFQCDVFFPPIPAEFKLLKESQYSQENAISYVFAEYRRGD